MMDAMTDSSYSIQANIVLSDRIVTDGFVHIDNNVIQSIGEDAVPDVAVIDQRNTWLLPGLIDLQVNGGGGLIFNDAKHKDDLYKITNAHLAQGTTQILATLITDDPDHLTRQITLIADAISQDSHLARHIAGIHLEGPFFHPERRGTHPVQFIMEPSVSWMETWIKAAKGTLKIVTLAPDMPQADQVIALLRDNHITVSLGHSNATYDQTIHALNNGATCGTHVFNAMAQWQGREPNIVGALIDHPASIISLINDGHHVHDASLRMALRAKSLDSIFFVSDAMHTLEQEETIITYRGVTMTARDGACFNDEGRLAGSVSPLFTALRRAVTHLGLSLPDAVRLCSTNPARLLNQSQAGRIAVGAQGPFILCDAELRFIRALPFS
jgi:N-acetylglucosamine-6-phosphate deacetylase